jgi:quercetin dioxygenase-like cupin family protein
MKRKWLLLLLLGVVGGALYGGMALATPPVGLTNLPLARGTDVSDGTLALQVGTDVAMAQITVLPGGSSGWHSHPGGAIIVVKQGSATVNRSIGSQCQTTTYGPGHMFIERPGEVDDVVNMGTDPYVLFVTFPRVPPGESPRIDQPDPGTCPGL